jgi:hypothetical protein
MGNFFCVNQTTSCYDNIVSHAQFTVIIIFFFFFFSFFFFSAGTANPMRPFASLMDI